MVKGRNAKSNASPRIQANNYKYATGFEALFGYLYLTGQYDRLLYLFNLIKNNELEIN